MIHPTRTNLLLLKEKVLSVYKSIGILKARRLALIREFLDTVKPFVKSREDIRKIYGIAIAELSHSVTAEGEETIKSLTFVTARELTLHVTEESIWGLKYKNVEIENKILRKADERGYDYNNTHSVVEDTIESFEKIINEMINMAKLEGKIKRLGLEIQKTSRKIKILEDKILPTIRKEIVSINQYLSERERESYYRLKIFKRTR
ncbi:MAG: hypothetical protein OHK0040_01760 [bacterium]